MMEVMTWSRMTEARGVLQQQQGVYAAACVLPLVAGSSLLQQ